MARKLRLEYPGACYHVINRGNYRADIFETEGAKKAFEDCLFEACGRSGWVLHAYVIMRNHYHLAVETPEGNLIAGMQWLQATFACRFNRFRNERGHLFQGRYKALLLEPGEALGQVCHYIHLNPVRAGVVTVAQLAEYRYSSYAFLRKERKRPAFLSLARALSEAGGLSDTPAGWRCYAQYLEWQAEAGPAGKTKAYVNLSKGWALGTKDFKTALLADHKIAAATRAWEASGAREIKESRAAEVLERCLRQLGKTRADALADRKGAQWKAAIALRVKETTQASNRWLADHLNMGRPEAVSVHIGRLKKSDPSAKSVARKKLTTVV